jgi:hypothetical protein
LISKKRSVLLGTAVFIAACGPSDSDFKEFSTYESPDGSNTIVVDYAHSIFAFGPETIRVFVIRKGGQDRNHIVTTKVSNDGGITAKNIKAEWAQENQIKFCLSGVEQEDSVLVIDLRDLSYSEIEEKCAS